MAQFEMTFMHALTQLFQLKRRIKKQTLDCVDGPNAVTQALISGNKLHGNFIFYQDALAEVTKDIKMHPAQLG